MPKLPEPSYYPSARVRLIVRFEEYTEPGTPEPPNVPPQLRRGTRKQQDPEKLKVIQQDNVLRLAGPEDAPHQGGGPQDQYTSQDKFTHVIDGIIPMGASLARNSVRIADTLNLTLNYRDLPIDSRVVRSVAVQFFLGCVSAEDYQRGILGEMRTTGIANNNVAIPYNVVPDTYVDQYGRARSNLRFEGWADDWDVEWPESGPYEVSLSCTDNTRLLLNQDHPGRMALNAELPIDQAIAEYLASFPQFRGLGVEYRPRGTGVEVPVLGKVLTRQAYPPGVGPPPKVTPGATTQPTPVKAKVWDYLTDVVTSIGLMLRMVGTVLVIQRPRTLYADKFLGREDDSFTGRILPNGRTITRRLFVYGENIQRMRARRNMTKYAPANVEIRSYNPARKKTLVQRYPTFVAQRQKLLAPGESSDQKYLVKTVAGIKDEATLRVIAQGVYEQLQRRELEFNIVTKNLGSLGGDNLDPDCLELEAGDSLDIEIKADTTAEQLNATTTVEQELRTRPYAFLRELGFPDAFARSYAQAINNIGFPTTFRVRDVQIDWGAGDGVSLDINAMNYVEVRADANLPAGEEIEPGDSQAQPVRIDVRDNT